MRIRVGLFNLERILLLSGFGRHLAWLVLVRWKITHICTAYIVYPGSLLLVYILLFGLCSIAYKFTQISRYILHSRLAFPRALNPLALDNEVIVVRERSL